MEEWLCCNATSLAESKYFPEMHPRALYDDETLEWMAGNMRAMKGQLEEESLNRMLAGLEAEKGVRVG